MKRKDRKLQYREEHAERAMFNICKTYKIDVPNHAVKDAYRLGFDTGVLWGDRNPIGVTDENYAWAIYNFINDWKNGQFGQKSLQQALNDFRYP